MLDLDLNVTLKTDELNKIITGYFEAEGFDVQKIDVKLKKQMLGSQMNEHEEIVFDGINITLKKQAPKIISSRDNWS